MLQNRVRILSRELKLDISSMSGLYIAPLRDDANVRTQDVRNNAVCMPELVCYTAKTNPVIHYKRYRYTAFFSS